MTDPAGDRQTAAEVAHWRLAVEALADLDVVASPEAWASLEEYLQRGIRDRLSGLVASLVLEARALERMAAEGRGADSVRSGGII